MPNARIKNSVVSVGVKNTTPNVRSSFSQVNVGILSTVVHVVSSRASYTTESTGTQIVAGNPIGLLLALTYAAPHSSGTTVTNSSDYKPNVRIITN